MSGIEQIVVEAVPGLGDELAAGTADAERSVVDDDGPRLVTGSRSALEAADARAIADLARRVEAEMGGPQDVEWALDDDVLVLLQARPITTGTVPPIPLDDPVPPGPWTHDATHFRRPLRRCSAPSSRRRSPRRSSGSATSAACSSRGSTDG